MRHALSSTTVRIALAALVAVIAAVVAVIVLTNGSTHASGSGRPAPLEVDVGPNPSTLPLAPLSSLGALVAAPKPGKVGLEGVAIPNSTRVFALPQKVHLGETIDGITCEQVENVSYHVHAHLTIFLDGAAFVIPYGIGIGPPLGGINTPAGPFIDSGACFMWLHTHAYDGVIHIESPTPTIYTLGQFFAVWGQPLSRTQLGRYVGKVTAFYDGKVWTGNPAAIPLTSATQIQLDIGRPLVAPEHIVFPALLLATPSTATTTTPTTTG